MKAGLAVVALVLALAAPALAQVLPPPPPLPPEFLRDPHPGFPWAAPWSPYHGGREGRPVAEHVIAERTVVIPMEVPQPGSLPSFIGPVSVTLPSYRVTETTAGFVVHGHWGVEPRNGVYYWTWRPTYFRTR